MLTLIISKLSLGKRPENIRIYDILSIILLSVFANTIIRDPLNCKWLLLLIGSFVGGVSFSFLYSLYIRCHDEASKSISMMNESRTYESYFEKEITARRYKFAICIFGIFSCFIFFIASALCEHLNDIILCFSKLLQSFSSK